MLKYILLVALATAVEQEEAASTSGSPDAIQPGDLDEYYEIDFEQDPDHIDEDNTQDDSEIMDNLP